MNPFDYILAGALIPLLCMLLGVWIWRHRERNNLAAAGREKAAMLEAARREAEAIAREARLAANEETLKLRSETEKRLNEREALVNTQLENLVREEKSLRAQRTELEGKLAEV